MLYKVIIGNQVSKPPLLLRQHNMWITFVNGLAMLESELDSNSCRPYNKLR